MATAKFHITPGGDVGICSAQKRPCPLGGEHFDNPEEAMREAMRRFQEANSTDEFEEERNDSATALGSTSVPDGTEVYAEFDDHGDYLSSTSGERTLDDLLAGLEDNALDRDYEGVSYARIGSYEWRPEEGWAREDGTEARRREVLDFYEDPELYDWKKKKVSPEQIEAYLAEKQLSLEAALSPSETFHARSSLDAKNTFLWHVADHFENKKRADTARRTALADADIEAKVAAIKTQNRSFGQLGDQRAIQKVEEELASLGGDDWERTLRQNERLRELQTVAGQVYVAKLDTFKEYAKRRDGGDPTFYDSLPAFDPNANRVPGGLLVSRDSWTPEDYAQEFSYEARQDTLRELEHHLEEKDPARYRRWNWVLQRPTEHLGYLSDDEFAEVRDRVRSMASLPEEQWELRQARQSNYSDWKGRLRANFLYGSDGDAA